MRPFLLTVFTSLLALRAAALPPPTTIEAERLVKQLGSDNFADREAATKALEAMGERALPRAATKARAATGAVAAPLTLNCYTCLLHWNYSIRSAPIGAGNRAGDATVPRGPMPSMCGT